MKKRLVPNVSFGAREECLGPRDPYRRIVAKSGFVVISSIWSKT